MVGLIGLIIIVAIVITLFQSKTVPAIAFIVWPALLAVILVVTGYLPDGWDSVADMVKAGFNSTGPTAALFVFSVLYFGLMGDAGMFDVIINRLMGFVGDSVIGVCVVTAVIALIAHLDGGGASTFCILVPAMGPVFKKMHMRMTSLLRIAVASMGILNLMPWAGPTMRAATVLGIEAGELWKTLIPIQIFGIAVAMGIAVLTGMEEKRRGAGLTGKLAQIEGEVEVGEAEEAVVDHPELKRPKLFLFNLALTVGVIAMLIWDVLPSYVPFMLGFGVALFVNYGFTAKAHKKIINLHAGPALMMCSTLMGAAILMGVLTTSFGPDGALKAKQIISPEMIAEGGITLSVVRCLANIIKSILPQALGQSLPLVIGFLSVPLALAFDTDSYFYGMLPVMIAIGEGFGVAALPIAVAMVVCRNCATFISPMVPATLLGTGLAGVDIKDHLKANFFWIWAFSILCMIFGVIMGILPL